MLAMPYTVMFYCDMYVMLTLDWSYLHHDIQLTPGGMRVPQLGKTQHQPWRSFSQPGMVHSTLNRGKQNKNMNIYNDTSQHSVCVRTEQTDGSL